MRQRKTRQVGEVLATIWIVLVGITFFLPWLGVGLPTGICTALYGIFLGITCIFIALGLMQDKTQTHKQDSDNSPA
jgi:uncharacterized membrane protein